VLALLPEVLVTEAFADRFELLRMISQLSRGQTRGARRADSDVVRGGALERARALDWAG